MTQVMVDCTHANLSRLPAGFAPPLIAGYTTGTPVIQWIPADWARFGKSGHVRIDQGFTWPPDPHSYDVLDVESFAVTAAQVPAAVKARIDAGITWTTIYGSGGALADVQAALSAAAAGPPGWYYGHVDCWLADWNLSGQQAAALLGTLVHGLTCRAVQWASPTSNPDTIVPGTSMTLSQAQVDLSVAADGWHTAPAPVAPHLVSVSAVAKFSDGSTKTWTVQ